MNVWTASEINTKKSPLNLQAGNEMAKLSMAETVIARIAAGIKLHSKVNVARA